jgi:hypothetical protein
MYVNVYNSFIHNCQKLKMKNGHSADEYLTNLLQPYRDTVFNSKKELLIYVTF